MIWRKIRDFYLPEGAIALFKIKWCIRGPKTPAKWGGNPRASSIACKRPMSWSSISSGTLKPSAADPEAPEAVPAAAADPKMAAAEAAAEAAPKSNPEAPEADEAGWGGLSLLPEFS